VLGSGPLRPRPRKGPAPRGRAGRMVLLGYPDARLRASLRRWGGGGSSSPHPRNRKHHMQSLRRSRERQRTALASTQCATSSSCGAADPAPAAPTTSAATMGFPLRALRSESTETYCGKKIDLRPAQQRFSTQHVRHCTCTRLAKLPKPTGACLELDLYSRTAREEEKQLNGYLTEKENIYLVIFFVSLSGACPAVEAGGAVPCFTDTGASRQHGALRRAAEWETRGTEDSNRCCSLELCHRCEAYTPGASVSAASGVRRCMSAAGIWCSALSQSKAVRCYEHRRNCTPM
jgi:hypothetical protein